MFLIAFLIEIKIIISEIPKIKCPIPAISERTAFETSKLRTYTTPRTTNITTVKFNPL